MLYPWMTIVRSLSSAQEPYPAPILTRQAGNVSRPIFFTLCAVRILHIYAPFNLAGLKDLLCLHSKSFIESLS